ncbi:MAG: D-glycero-beta-D-manno-heptose 1,7-bisphosphate 7-phosphatase [Phycisphaerae bacterium]
MARKAVFLDRDGTINEDTGYVSSPDEVKLLPGVELAIKSLAQAGYLIVVVTNQSGIARGMFTEQTLESIHQRLTEMLQDKGARIDSYYCCPYLADGAVEQYAVDSDLRKPRPGMLLNAAEEMDIDLSRSWMVGDSARDVEAGQRAGCRTIRLRHPGTLDRNATSESAQADYVVRNLVDAARVIIREENRAAAPTVAEPGAARPAMPENGGGDEVETAAMQAPAPQGTIPGHKRGVSRLGLSAEELAREQNQATAPGRGGGSSELTEMLLRRISEQLDRYVVRQGEQFSVTKLLAGVTQMLVVMALIAVFWKSVNGHLAEATLWAIVSVTLQAMSLTLYVMNRLR